MKKSRLNRYLLLSLLLSLHTIFLNITPLMQKMETEIPMVHTVNAENGNQDPYGTIHDEVDFKWAHDQVKYDIFTDGVPSGVNFHRIAILAGEVGESWAVANNMTPFRYVAHIANDSNNKLAGRMFQWLDFFDENGKDWHIHLHLDGYHMDDEKGFLQHLAGSYDIAYMKANPQENITQGVLNFTLTPPEKVINSQGLNELTWSLVEHRVAYFPGDGYVNVAHSAKIKHTWHFYVKNGSAHLKEDLSVFDAYFSTGAKNNFIDFDNGTFANFWHIGVFSTPDAQGGQNLRPDSYEIDGTTYDSPTIITSGYNVSIKFENVELSQIDLGTEFNVSSTEGNDKKPITTEVRVIPEWGDVESPEDGTGLSLILSQKFPGLNYSNFQNFTMDPEITVPLNSISENLEAPENSQSNPSEIPGYNIILFLGMVSTISVIIIKKRLNFRK